MSSTNKSTASDAQHDESVKRSADIRQALSSEGFTRDKNKVSFPPVVSRMYRCKNGTVLVSFLPASPSDPFPAFTVSAKGVQHELVGMRACVLFLTDVRNGNFEGELSKVTVERVVDALSKFGFSGKQQLDEGVAIDGLCEAGAPKKGTPKKGTPEWHECRIACDTVRNPAKALLGGPSADEAERKLLNKFGYTQAEVDALKEEELFDPTGVDRVVEVAVSRLVEAAAYSAFWGKEQNKWLDVIEHQATNLATSILFIRQWAPTQPKYALDREKVVGHLERMRKAADLLSSSVDEVSDFLKDSLFNRHNYQPRG